MSGLAIEYFDEKTLEGIGNLIGSTLKVDTNTTQQTRGKFARICVEINLNKPLVPFYYMDEVLLHFAYEGIHLICFHCGKYGHAKESCQDKKNQDVHVQKGKSADRVNIEGKPADGINPGRSIPVQDNTDGEEQAKGDYGPWMLVERKPRRKTILKGKAQEGKHNRNGDKVASKKKGFCQF